MNLFGVSHGSPSEQKGEVLALSISLTSRGSFVAGACTGRFGRRTRPYAIPCDILNDVMKRRSLTGGWARSVTAAEALRKSTVLRIADLYEIQNGVLVLEGMSENQEEEARTQTCMSQERQLLGWSYCELE